jgi:hypothetical protein
VDSGLKYLEIRMPSKKAPICSVDSPLYLQIHVIFSYYYYLYPQVY